MEKRSVWDRHKLGRKTIRQMLTQYGIPFQEERRGNGFCFKVNGFRAGIRIAWPKIHAFRQTQKGREYLYSKLCWHFNFGRIDSDGNHDPNIFICVAWPTIKGGRCRCFIIPKQAVSAWGWILYADARRPGKYEKFLDRWDILQH